MAGKILVYHHGALGDVVVFFPALERLKQNFDAIDLVCRGNTGNLARRLGVADTTYPIESAVFSSLYTQRPRPQAAAIIKQYDMILLLSESTTLFQRVSQLFKKAVACQIPPRPPAGERIHVLRHIETRLADQGLLEPPDINQRPVISANKGRAVEWNPDPEKLTIAIHPGSGSPRKNRPLEFYKDIYDLLRRKGRSAKFLLGPAESDIKPVLDGFSIPYTDLEENPESLVDALLSTAGLICNDSGVAHLSAYIGVPTLSLFGPSDPARWRPQGKQAISLRPDTDCDPCFETRERNCEHPLCLTRISPVQAIDAFNRLVQYDSCIPGRQRSEL